MEKMKNMISAKQGSLDHIVTFAYCWLDNVAYIHDDVLNAMREQCRANNIDFSSEFFANEDSEAQIQSICSNIYSSNNSKYILFAMY